ncbi:ankyrin repeat-containing domain protein [Xylaria flabelliformis]|nr:ankyrin repeat-containing domain protein [Xylaria flabelliformis]
MIDERELAMRSMHAPLPSLHCDTATTNGTYRQQINILGSMAEPSRKKQRRHLNYDKCRCCRQAKKACTPIKRIWPQKCHRCTELELECSESTRAAGAPHLVPPQPVSQVVNATDTQEMYDLSLRVTWLRRLKLYQKTVDAAIEAQKILFDNNNNTPLFKAAGEGRTDIVQLLLKNGANVNSKNIYGYTPLFGPAAGGRADIVRLLLEKGANINSKDDYGNTPLSKAVKHGRIRIVQLLLEKGADLSTETTDVTLIQTAVVYGHMEIAEKLRAAARERYTLAGNPRLS